MTIAAGTVAGLLLRTLLKDQFDAARGRLMLAICNGFQIAVRAGWFGDGVAGVTTPDGLAFGLMNHPERALDPRVRLAFSPTGVRAARGLG